MKEELIKKLEIETILETKWNASSEKHHCSLLRSHSVLRKVIQMMKRGDSQKTIFEMINFLYCHKYGFDLENITDEVEP